MTYSLTGFTVTADQVVGSFIFFDMHPGNISLPIELILFLQFNDDGEITEVTFLSRPLTDLVRCNISSTRMVFRYFIDRINPRSRSRSKFNLPTNTRPTQPNSSLSQRA